MNSLCVGKFAIFAILTIAIQSLALASDVSLPSGWRMPTRSELNDDWRNKDPDRYSVVRGDFNDDGFVDAAKLLVSLQGHGLGFFVFLSQKNGTFKTYRIDAIKDPSFLQVMGIAKILPGKYQTACGKGYWECKKAEPPEILIEHDTIEYFKSESASSYFYWDKRAKAFKRIWISD